MKTILFLFISCFFISSSITFASPNDWRTEFRCWMIESSPNFQVGVDIESQVQTGQDGSSKTIYRLAVDEQLVGAPSHYFLPITSVEVKNDRITYSEYIYSNYPYQGYGSSFSILLYDFNHAQFVRRDTYNRELYEKNMACQKVAASDDTPPSIVITPRPPKN